MNFACQSSALDTLKELASKRYHSVLIDGPEGSGKSYLAGVYAELLSVSDFQSVEPTVQAIRDAIDACYQINTPVVISIENLDNGVIGASYTLLKFLEEPKSNVFLVVTVRNRNRVPDTIVSRSVCVCTSPPIVSDIQLFAKTVDPVNYLKVSNLRIWQCVRTFKDASTVLSMSSDHLNYFEDLQAVSTFHDSVSNIVWKLGHYADNSDTPVELVVRYLMLLVPTMHMQLAGISCLKDLTSGRIAAHAVLAKFVFECKYCE